MKFSGNKDFRILVALEMSAQIAGGVAIFFSVAAMVACLIAVPAVYQRVANIKLQLRTDMDEFQVTIRFRQIPRNCVKSSIYKS